jgi:putative hydrolase
LEEQPNREELERLIRKMMESGQLDPEDLAKIAGFSADPSMLSDLFGQVSAMTGESGEPVNWKLALNQALELSKKTEKPANSALEAELETAFDMARLWLSEATEFTNPNPPKKLTRSMWAQEAMPLFRELSEPVANSMAAALNENLGNTLPPELSEMLAPAQNFIGNAGASIFAMQLGQAIGKLSSEVLLSGEIGIPLTVRPGIIAQNLGEFLEDLETPKSEVLIYLATRELAIASLYNQAGWLREQIITQVREFAAGLTVDLSGIEEIASRIDPTDPGSMEQIIEASAMVSPRSPEQEQALERIETVLALIEGWVDATSLEATKRLPNIQAVVEIFNRKRATNGASAKTFEALLGLEMRPRLRREATLMWQRVVADIGKNASDDLWSHPDQMPTALEIENPDSLISRIKNNGDDFEDELRKFLTD